MWLCLKISNGLSSYVRFNWQSWGVPKSIISEALTLSLYVCVYIYIYYYYYYYYYMILYVSITSALASPCVLIKPPFLDKPKYHIISVIYHYILSIFMVCFLNPQVLTHPKLVIIVN